MQYWHYIFIFAVVFTSCQGQEEIPREYPRMIGDIAFDPMIDTTDFELCNDENFAVQYYAFTKTVNGKPYLNEKYEVEKIFSENYDAEMVAKESGLLRIRFIVNCEGVAGRFRILGMDENYQGKEFDSSISTQLLFITKNLLEWQPFQASSGRYDYYMYLTFKLEKGKIIEILP